MIYIQPRIKLHIYVDLKANLGVKFSYENSLSVEVPLHYAAAETEC